MSIVLNRSRHESRTSAEDFSHVHVRLLHQLHCDPSVRVRWRHMMTNGTRSTLEQERNISIDPLGSTIDGARKKYSPRMQHVSVVVYCRHETTEMDARKRLNGCGMAPRDRGL
ncbi:hypothetical protein AC1031_020404 [Aphanomyces cochlioides]|nr:hypothetical protein AC1031_020404 [Aphanomyces cochlioides]